MAKIRVLLLGSAQVRPQVPSSARKRAPEADARWARGTTTPPPSTRISSADQFIRQFMAVAVVARLCP